MRKNYNIKTSHQFVILLVKLFASLCITMKKYFYIVGTVESPRSVTIYIEEHKRRKKGIQFFVWRHVCWDSSFL